MGYRLDSQNLIPSRGRNFSLVQCPEQLYPMGTRPPSPEVKQPGDHSPPPSAEVKIGTVILPLPISFQGVVLN
jgi:hypothetical protein